MWHSMLHIRRASRTLATNFRSPHLPHRCPNQLAFSLLSRCTDSASSVASTYAAKTYGIFGWLTHSSGAATPRGYGATLRFWVGAYFVVLGALSSPLFAIALKHFSALPKHFHIFATFADLHIQWSLATQKLKARRHAGVAVQTGAEVQSVEANVSWRRAGLKWTLPTIYYHSRFFLFE